MVPAGVTNHQRRAAWGRKHQQRCFCMIVQRRLPLTDFLARLPRLPSGTRSSAQARHAHTQALTRKHALTRMTRMLNTRSLCSSFSTTAVWGGCVQEITYFLLPFLPFGGFLSHTCPRLRTQPADGGADRNGFAGGLKQQ